MEARPANPSGIVMSVIRHPQLVGLLGEIPDSDVVEFENFPHITIRYGVTEYDPKKLQTALGSMDTGFQFLDGLVTGFDCFEGVRDGACDCVFLKVDDKAKEKLEAVKEKVEETLECEESQFAEYKPHITLAYVKPGKGRQICDMLSDKFMEYDLDKLWIDEVSVFYSDGKDQEATIYFNLVKSNED
jgi:2'-5' RNA ligase